MATLLTPDDFAGTVDQKFAALLADGRAAMVPGGTYTLTGPLVPSAGDRLVIIDPAAHFPAARPSIYPMIDWVGNEVAVAGIGLSKTFDESYGYVNANVVAAQATTTGATQANAVAGYFAGIAGSSATLGGGAWAINSAAFATVAGAVAIAHEADASNLHPEGKTYGVVAVGTGYYPNQAAFQVQCTKVGPVQTVGDNRFIRGFYLNDNCLTRAGTAFGGGDVHCGYGLRLTGDMYLAEIDLPSFKGRRNISRRHHAHTGRRLDGGDLPPERTANKAVLLQLGKSP